MRYKGIHTNEPAADIQLTSTSTQHFGRVLSRIRDEYEAYISFLHNHPSRQTGGASANQSGDRESESDQLRLENESLRQTCAALKHEVRLLQASTSMRSPGGDESGDDLEDVQLCPEIDDDATITPYNVPLLNLAVLSPYDQEEEEEECYDDGYSEDLQYHDF
ncbi:hypothetical protein PINS_up008676 [Pythium insidiosum]|nr:hypothetical protein PINS_up008676 [Pythium insidiosum]